MSQLRAVIEGENNLQCWNRAINGLCKIGEYISFDINSEGMSLFTFNASRSVYSKARYQREFFKEYRHGRFGALNSRNAPALTMFELQTKIMASIFRKMEREKANVGHCLIEYRESQGHGSSARLEITVVLKSGITKSYRIPTMELDQSYDFKIDHTQVSNHFTCEAKLLKLYMEHMSLRAEEFELKVGETSLEMASYTVGVSSETEILKHPLGTRIALGVEEFLSAKLEIGLAIIIRLKELRTLVSLADSFQNRTTLTCFFHKPEYPMLMEISGPMVPAGVALVYIFMTHGRYNDNLPIEADRPFLIREEGIADENKEDGNDSQAPSMVAVVPRVEVDLSGEDDSVRWDNSMQVDEIPQASRAANYNRNVDTMDEDEDLEDDFDQQLASFADELEKRALGPTQNASQARGLFD